MSSRARTLHGGFLRSEGRFPDRPALEVQGSALSYRALGDVARRLAKALIEHGDPAPDAPRLTAVFAHRSMPAFAGVLAALLRGHGYVPLNPTFPTDRTRGMLARSGARAVIVDATCEAQLAEVLAGATPGMLLVFPERADVADLASGFPMHRVLGRDDLPGVAGFTPKEAGPDDLAYLLFTSGSTGIPKGVMVAQRNVAHFVDVMVERYAIDENDRFSQMFDFTFDLSAFDLFVAWERGACVVCPSKEAAFMPYTFLQEAKLSVWFSVPSIGVQMRKLRMLDPDMYPTLRLSLFCGEALPASMVEAWALAAPNARIENLYGPTEATIACTLYRWDPARSPDECESGIVPIGAPYPGMRALVVDESLREVAPGETGELLMSGPQVSLGYWNDPEKTAASFVVPDGQTELHYRTGDRVRSPRSDGEPLRYLGRADHQIKIRGYRVELGEVEAALRKAAEVDVAIAVGWPPNEGGADSIVAFIGAARIDAPAIKAKLKAALPGYMVPSSIKAMADMPLNASGKVDRNAILAQLAAKAKA